MSSQSRDIARNAATIAAATFLSRALGFARDMVLAFVLGAGPVADAFFVAFRLPNMLRNLFGEGSLTMSFVPVFSKTLRDSGREDAFALARSAQFWLTLILGALVALAVAFAGPLTSLIAPGFARSPEQFDLTVRLVRICFPFALLICSVALCMGVLNSLGHFLYPALAPCMLNVVLIAAGLGSVWLGGDTALILAWSVLVAGVLQWLMQLPALRAKGFTWIGPWPLAHPGIRRMGLLLLPSLFGAAVYQTNILLSTLLATFLPTGSVSYLYYADRLVQFPLGVFGVAVSMAALPNLSALAAEGKKEEFSSTLEGAVRLSLFIALPATAGLVALATPMVEILFNRGAFTPDAVRATSLALMAYAAGLPAFATVRPLISACYARQDTRRPVAAAFISLATFGVLGPLLMAPLKHVGLALAVSAAAWVNAWFLRRHLRHTLGSWPGMAARIMRFSLLSLGLGLAAWGTWRLCPVWPALVSLGFIPVWAWLYLHTAGRLNLEEARLFQEALMGRLRRRR